MISKAGAGAIIKNSDGYVFLVKTERRGMVRWELPSGIRNEGESIFITLYRRAEKESLSQFTVRIGRAVCMVLNRSIETDHQYFGMFFECKAEVTGIKIEDITVDLPDELRENVIEAAYMDWRQLDPIEIHPQHLEILKKWSNNPDGPLFAVVSDADSERAFYHKKGSVSLCVLDPLSNSYAQSPGGVAPPHLDNETHLKKIFISYSKKDNQHKENLLSQLSGLRDRIVTWNDRDIVPGDNWESRINEELHQANIVLYLVTANSMASDYIQNIELPLIEARCLEKKCTLIPIIVDFCLWKNLDFAKYNALPDNGVPVLDTSHWVNENQAWLNVIRGIERKLSDNFIVPT